MSANSQNRQNPARQQYPSIALLLRHAVLTMFTILLAAPILSNAESEIPTDFPNWKLRQDLPADVADALPDFCAGTYVRNDIAILPDNRLEASGLNFEWSDNRGRFSGDVQMNYGDVQITSDGALWDDESRQGEYRGHVQVINPYATLIGESAGFTQTGDNLSDGDLRLHQAMYVLPDGHMRGTAGTLVTEADDTVMLKEGTLTFCEPGNDQWQLAASSIYLDRRKGIGSAWNTRLEIYDVPVFYLPYYRFPIDDRRMTGFLDPSFALNGDAQLEEFQAPFYINIAPNLDATITPHFINDHGWIWENQFRHKTELLGDGELNYEFLGKDATTGEERSYINYSQNGRFLSNWSHRWVYNQVSDDDYFQDLNSAGSGNHTTHLPRRGEIHYQTGSTDFLAMGESYQTIDPSIALSDRPYRRLPQLELNMRPELWRADSNRLSSRHQIQLTQFERDQTAVIDGTTEVLTGSDALNAKRLVFDNDLSYRLENLWGYLETTVGYRYRQYQLYGVSETELDHELNQSVQTPRAALDAGITLERPLNLGSAQYVQTLEPRIFHVVSPYQSGQDDIPVFDTAYQLSTYDNLFSGERFVGYDRLADQNQTSLGLTTRFLNESGNQTLSTSIGKAFYHNHRKVQLPDDENDYFQLDTAAASSSLMTNTQWRPNPDMELSHFMEWDQQDSFSRQQRFAVNYQPVLENQHQLKLVNMGLNQLQYIDPDTETPKEFLYQLDTSLFWSINDSWAISGRLLRDLKSYDSDERRPASPVLESLAGIEYQNCCWRFQLTYREYSKTNNDDPVYSTDKRYNFMFSIQLKGLTTLGGSTDDLLKSSIPGYSRRTYHDY